MKLPKISTRGRFWILLTAICLVLVVLFIRLVALFIRGCSNG